MVSKNSTTELHPQSTVRSFLIVHYYDEHNDMLFPCRPWILPLSNMTMYVLIFHSLLSKHLGYQIKYLGVAVACVYVAFTPLISGPTA